MPIISLSLPDTNSFIHPSKEKKDMKKFTTLFVALLAACATVSRAEDGKVIPASQLPAAAQAFISQHFAGRKVAVAKAETNFATKTYEVVFADGDHVEFDGKGRWEEIDCSASAVPAALVPAPIRKYVEANYPGATVLKIEKDRREYEVKLSNRMELTFDRKFNLTDIDR